MLLFYLSTDVITTSCWMIKRCVEIPNSPFVFHGQKIYANSVLNDMRLYGCYGMLTSYIRTRGMFVFAVSVLIALPKGIALLAKQNCNQSTTEAAGSFLPVVSNRMKLFNLLATTDLFLLCCRNFLWWSKSWLACAHSSTVGLCLCPNLSLRPMASVQQSTDPKL